MADELVFEVEDFGTVRLPYSLATFQVELDDGGEDHRSCRVFYPPTIDEVDLAEYATEALGESVRTAGEEDDDWREFDLLVWLEAMLPNKDRRRHRQFNPRTFDRCETLRSLTAATSTQHSDVSERVVAAVGRDDQTLEQGLAAAWYERPRISLPYPVDSYEQFREFALRELSEIREDLYCTIGEAVNAAARQEVKQRGGKRVTRRRMDELWSKLDEGPFWDNTHKGLRKVLARAYAETERQEARHAARYEDIIRRVNAIQEVVIERVEQRRIAVFIESAEGVSYTSEFEAVVAESLPRSEADELLRRMLARIEEDHGLSPLEVVDLGEFEAGEPTTEEEGADLPEFTLHEQYQQSITLALASDDLMEKWIALYELRDQFVDRTECMRLLQREAELATAAMMGMAAREVYRQIRKELSAEDRRLFRLLYLPMPWLDGRIAAFEPLCWSFLLGMDVGTQWLVYSVLVRKSQDAEQRDELERRWSAFVRFYPHWLDMVRHDERERRRQGRVPHARYRQDRIPDRSVISPEMAMQFSAVTSEKLPALAARHCTASQAKYLTSYFGDGLTETAIAAAHGVTQQAVSKTIRQGLCKLRAGLRSEGVTEIESS